MSSIQWQDEEQSLPAPKHPLWDYDDNVLGSLRSPCLDPSPSPQHNSILQLCIHYLATSNFNWTHCGALTTIFLMFDGCFFHMAACCKGTPYSGERRLVNALWMGCCSAPDARFLLSRKMMVRHENMPLPHSNTIDNINISPLKIFHVVFTKTCHRRCTGCFLELLRDG